MSTGKYRYRIYLFITQCFRSDNLDDGLLLSCRAPGYILPVWAPGGVRGLCKAGQEVPHLPRGPGEEGSRGGQDTGGEGEAQVPGDEGSGEQQTRPGCCYFLCLI